MLFFSLLYLACFSLLIISLLSSNTSISGSLSGFLPFFSNYLSHLLPPGGFSWKISFPIFHQVIYNLVYKLGWVLIKRNALNSSTLWKNALSLGISTHFFSFSTCSLGIVS